MSDKVFVDSSILIAAYDNAAPDRQRLVLKLLEQLVKTNTGVVSAQVLAELFVAVTEKLSVPLSAVEGCDRIQTYLQVFAVVDITAAIALEAARGVRIHQLNFWASQIWATARLNQIRVVLTDTALAGSIVEGIRFLNPLTPTFKLETLP